jgi:hypothetical protein
MGADDGGFGLLGRAPDEYEVDDSSLSAIQAVHCCVVYGPAWVARGALNAVANLVLALDSVAHGAEAVDGDVEVIFDDG